MSTTLFISIEAQQSYFLILRVIFSISMATHLISILFLTKFTPPKQAAWRNYMLYIQACLISFDVYVEIALVPIPLFPAPCAYTTGILCRMSIPLQIQAGIGFLLMVNLAASIDLCVLYRHQSILVGASGFRLGKNATRIAHILLILAFSFPPVSYSLFLQDQKLTDQLLQLDPRNLTWVTQRGCYFYQHRGLYQKVFVIEMCLVILISNLFLALMFIHMNHVLTRDTHTKSSLNTRNKRKSVAILFAQLITPLFLQAIPGAIIFTAIAADGLVSFEHCLVLFTVFLLHPIVHNTLLVSLTPTFRLKIVHALQLKNLQQFRLGTSKNIRFIQVS